MDYGKSTRYSEKPDYEVELRLELRFGRRVHILTTDDGMIIAHGYPYHGDRFIRVPESMEAAILELCADPTLPPSDDPGAFLNDGTKIKPRQIHPFYDQPEEDQPSAFPPSERGVDK